MLLEFRNIPLRYILIFCHATIGVVVERCKSIVDVFWSEEKPQPADCQQFIEHAPMRKKVSLKTLAKVLSNNPRIQMYLISLGHFSTLKHRKPKSANESIQVVEDIVEAESTMKDVTPSPRKRRFEEIDPESFLKVKTERSMSTGSSLSGTTSSSSLGYIKMEIDPPNTVDEETSNAASILNGVSMDRRTVLSHYKKRQN